MKTIFFKSKYFTFFTSFSIMFCQSNIHAYDFYNNSSFNKKNRFSFELKDFHMTKSKLKNNFLETIENPHADISAELFQFDELRFQDKKIFKNEKSNLNGFKLRNEKWCPSCCCDYN